MADTLEQMAMGHAFATGAQTQGPMQYGRQRAQEMGTYEPERDPQYWEHVGIAMERQTPEAHHAVWRMYGDDLPYQDFEEFEQATFHPAEDTPRYHEMRQLRAQTDHLIEQELPHNIEMMRQDREAGEMELEGLRQELQFQAETFDDRADMISEELRGMELSNEAQTIQNQFEEWRSEFEMEELAPRQLREYDIELAGMEHALQQDRRLAPYERDLLAAQVASERAAARSRFYDAELQEFMTEAQLDVFGRMSPQELRSLFIPDGAGMGVDDGMIPSDFMEHTEFDRAMQALEAGQDHEYWEQFGLDRETIRRDPDHQPEEQGMTVAEYQRQVIADLVTGGQGGQGVIMDLETGGPWRHPAVAEAELAQGADIHQAGIVYGQELFPEYRLSPEEAQEGAFEALEDLLGDRPDVGSPEELREDVYRQLQRGGYFTEDMEVTPEGQERMVQEYGTTPTMLEQLVLAIEEDEVQERFGGTPRYLEDIEEEWQSPDYEFEGRRGIEW